MHECASVLCRYPRAHMHADVHALPRCAEHADSELFDLAYTRVDSPLVEKLVSSHAQA